jgi:hypothetical protein
MKKLLVSAILLATGFVNAQEIKTNAGTFTKPKTNDILIEINFSPDLTGGGQQGIFSLPVLSNDMNLLGIKGRKFISDSKAIRAIANLSISNSGEEGATTNFSVGAGIGIENHRKGAERLSPYWGYEGKIGLVSGGSTKASSPNYGIKTTKFGIAANVFSGFDYYIIPNIYLGAEISYGLAITNSKQAQASAITKFELAPGITPSFRMGWKF